MPNTPKSEDEMSFLEKIQSLMSTAPVKIAEIKSDPPPSGDDDEDEEFDAPDFDSLSPEEKAAFQERKEARKNDPELQERIAKTREELERKPAERRARLGKGPAPEPEVDAEEAEARGTMETAQELFQTTHGGPFDPKSSMDKKKMAVIQKLMESGEDFGNLGGTSDEAKQNRTKFALKIYRMG
tara:strand:- start:996 stop:1547 length:552 start_codon:yes stop_codon:yes gene_type:complete